MYIRTIKDCCSVRCLISFPGCVCDTRWKHLEACHRLKGAYWGNAYWRKGWQSWHTELHTHTLPLLPHWGNSDRGSPTCHCGSNYPAGSLHGPSPAGLHITNHITEHTHTEYAHWRTEGHTLHTRKYTYCTYSQTHTRTSLHARMCFSSAIRSPQANGLNES